MMRPTVSSGIAAFLVAATTVLRSVNVRLSVAGRPSGSVPAAASGVNGRRKLTNS